MARLFSVCIQSHISFARKGEFTRYTTGCTTSSTNTSTVSALNGLMFNSHNQFDNWFKFKIKTAHFYVAFSWVNLPLKRSEWHVLTRITQFFGTSTCQPATHTFIHEWNEPSCLYSRAAEHHRTLAGTHFPSTQDWRLSWPGWLVTYRGDMSAARRRPPIPVPTAAAGDRTLDQVGRPNH